MDFLERLKAWVDSSAMHHQIQNVDVAGLFSNPWFVVPLSLFVVYSLWRKDFWSLIFVGVIVGVWMLLGTELMSGLVQGGEISQEKVFPVIGVGVVTIIVLVLLIFGRS